MKRYNPTEIEKKWQDAWERDGTYVVDFNDTSKPKYYGMSMLPGITGAGIHIGHGRTFQFSDIKVRAKRQQGYNAYNPIGWDSFGLPVENYAIKVGKTPREAHDEAKEHFISQLKRLGYSYDWTKEISTADPQYYRWTQWIFNQLLKHDLAYQKESAQWWCETDSTVLANEQVEGGKCWRCGNQVTKRNLKQWFFRITAYADEILEATDELDWTDMVKSMQKNWIGKSQGAEIEFSIDGLNDIITVFSTRPDTLFGATFLVLAPEHELVEKLITDETEAAVTSYVAETKRKSEIERMNDSREKTGVFTGSYAINPATGERIPIWVADYVLAGYGTGAIMAVPAHDERDFAFATAFNLPVVQVIADFEVFSGDLAPRNDWPTREKQVVDAIITDGEGNYLLQTERDGDTLDVHFVGGGVDDSDATIEDAIRREVLEEAGYPNIISIKQAAPYSGVHAQRKIKNRNHKTWGAYYEVVVDTSVQVKSEIDEGMHGAIWVPKDEVEGHITWSTHAAGWRDYLAGKTIDTEVREGVLVNSGVFNGRATSEAREEVVAWLEQEETGRAKTTFKMRDWLISRQRYWGAPIPVVHVDGFAPIAVRDEQLPVLLPEVEDFKPKGGNTSVLAEVDDWVRVWVNVETGETVPITESKPEGSSWHEGRRETDTMDGYACSSWYPLRYLDPFNDKAAWDVERVMHWAPVDYYNGADHAVAHLLYTRFWMRFFHKLGLVPTPEPFKRMMYNAYIMAPDGEKMSKSKGNVIDPIEIMDSGYGADSLRVYEMFIAPYDMDAPWDTRGVPGTYRFLSRVWNLVQEYSDADTVVLDDAHAKEVLVVAHKTARKVTSDIEDEKFNTAISSMMETVNSYYKLKEKGIGKSDAWTYAIESLLMVLSPFAPHITEELWHQLGHTDTIHVDHWPRWDDVYLQEDVVTLIVQVNGKVRAKLSLAPDTPEDDVKKLALQDEHVQRFIEGKDPKKVIYVPGRLLNIVV